MMYVDEDGRDVKRHIFWDRRPGDGHMWVTTICGIGGWNFYYTVNDPEEADCRSCLNIVTRKIARAQRRLASLSPSDSKGGQG